MISKKKSKRKTKTSAQLAEACAKDLQLLVRMKASDDQGYCMCVTCDAIKHYKEMQGGHFFSRGKTATKLVEENIHPQCPGCNKWGMDTNGILVYRKYMIEMYGEDGLKRLEEQSRTINKWVKSEIAELHDDIKQQLKYQRERLGV